MRTLLDYEGVLDTTQTTTTPFFIIIPNDISDGLAYLTSMGVSWVVALVLLK